MGVPSRSGDPREHNWDLFYILFLAALGLCCCTWAFSSCGEWGLLFIVACGLLTVVASRCRARILECMGFSSCSGGLKSCGFWAIDHRLNTCAAWAQLLLGMWGPPRSEIQPVSPALAGRFFMKGGDSPSSAPPGPSGSYAGLNRCASRTAEVGDPTPSQPFSPHRVMNPPHPGLQALPPDPATQGLAQGSPCTLTPTSQGPLVPRGGAHGVATRPADSGD